jgi:predicted ABC-type transport system involved in lysophospholipase L1 biosynthesis ATPase subunit
VKLNLMRTVLDGSSQTAQRLFNRLGLEQRLKTLWRKKLAGGKNAPEQTESGPEES